MKDIVAETDWQPVPPGYLEKMLFPKVAPYESSLLGEYARLFLLLLVVPMVFCFAYFALNNQTGLLCLVATTILLATLTTSRGYPVFRIALLLGMTANLFALAINPSEVVGRNRVGASEPSVFFLLLSLGTASVFEVVAWTKSSIRTNRYKSSIAAIPSNSTKD